MSRLHARRLYRCSDLGWECAPLTGSVAKTGLVSVEWLSGPLAGREARVEAKRLEGGVVDASSKMRGSGTPG